MLAYCSADKNLNRCAVTLYYLLLIVQTLSSGIIAYKLFSSVCQVEKTKRRNKENNCPLFITQFFQAFVLIQFQLNVNYAN